MDSAADQSVIGQWFKIMFYTGQHIKMDGALVGMEGGQYPIVSAAAVVEDETSDQLIIVVANQAAYNLDIRQHESLLHTDQAILHGVKINDLASCFKDGHGHIGKQSPRRLWNQPPSLWILWKQKQGQCLTGISR